VAFEIDGDGDVMGKDLWRDHPVQQQVAEPSPKPAQVLPVPAKLPEKAISPEEDTRRNKCNVGDSLGQGPDGRSKRERKEMS
jgi:hypothetical protein